GDEPFPGEHKQVVNALEFLTEKTPKYRDKPWIVVHGAGPTGAWVVEKALKENAQVYWFAREADSFSRSSPVNRNDLVMGLTKEWRFGGNLDSLEYDRSSNLIFVVFKDAVRLHDNLKLG